MSDKLKEIKHTKNTGTIWYKACELESKGYNIEAFEDLYKALQTLEHDLFHQINIRSGADIAINDPCIKKAREALNKAKL